MPAKLAACVLAAFPESKGAVAGLDMGAGTVALSSTVDIGCIETVLVVKEKRFSILATMARVLVT